MNKDRSRVKNYHYSIFLLALLTSACTAPKNTVVQQPVTQADPPAQVVVPTSQTIQQPVSQNSEQLYQSALTKADSAKAISQSAASKDDWVLVASNLQSSVEILKSIDPTSPQSNLAAKILPEYEQQLAIAKQKADNFVSKPVQNITSTSQITSSSSLDTFTIPIQRKLGGVPLIEVTFNDNHQVQMLLDTGASNTLVTAAVATQLQLQPNGLLKPKQPMVASIFKLPALIRSDLELVKSKMSELRSVKTIYHTDY